MAFINKFKNKKGEEKVPEGVKVEYSSFGQPQAGYNPNLVQQNLNSFTGNTPSHTNVNSNQSQTNQGSFAQTSVWSNEDDSNATKLNTAQNKSKAKPNFMQKKEVNQAPPQPQPQQQQQQVVSNHTQNAQPTTTNQGQRQEINLKIEQKPIPKKTKFEVKNELDLLDDNDMNFPELEFQKKLVNDVVAPGGIRPKQQQDLLNSFSQDCLSLSPCVIGSLIINKLFSNEANIVKQRALYAAEILVKTYSKFQDFFKKQQYMIQKSQQFNQNDSKFVSLSNQLLAVVSNPSLDISEANDINFNFSQSKDLSKYGKKNEVTQSAPVVQQQQTTQQSKTVNLIDDDDELIQQTSYTQQTIQPTANQTYNKSQGLFKNLNKKAATENVNIAAVQTNQVQQIPPQQQQSQQAQTKPKLFDKFKPKSNATNTQQENDLLNIGDDAPSQNNGTQGLQDKFSLLNLYDGNTPNSNKNNNSQQAPSFNQTPNNYNNSQFYPQPQVNYNVPPNSHPQNFYPHPPANSFNGQHAAYPYPQNGGYPYPPHQAYGYGGAPTYGQQANNYSAFNSIQQPQAYKTINMEFGDNKQFNLEQQYFNQASFNIDDNTPNHQQKNQTQQNNKKQVNEDAFDFISL